MTRTDETRNAILFYGGFAFRAGGAFMHTMTLSEGLQARGWSVTTVTLDRLPRLVRYLPHLVERLVNVFSAPLGFYYKGVLTRLLYKYFINWEPTDLLVFEDIYLGWNSANPSISMLHATWSDNLQSFAVKTRNLVKLKRKEVKAINRLTHPVITVSNPYREFLEKEHFSGIGVISLEVVELGLNMNRFDALQKGSRVESSRSLIYCGALEARKNVRFMLEVFGLIFAQDPSATLTIVGDGPDSNDLIEYAKQHRLPVSFLGRLAHKDVLEELKNHNIYIHTALKESFSFALLEAKLSGLTTCALSSLEVPENFIDVGFEQFAADDWCKKILAIKSAPDMSEFPDYSIERMTAHTLSLVFGE